LSSSLPQAAAWVALGTRRVDRLQALENELTGRGSKAIAAPIDVTHADEVKKLVDAAVQTFGVSMS
jgi:NADP-dependent 3-hydroxy acid dehydrogenase YdfG